MSIPPPKPRGGENFILSAMRGTEQKKLASAAELITLGRGAVVYEPTAEIDYVYFPETAVFSMLAVMENGDTVEVGPVGDEGMVGLGVVFGGDKSSARVLVHVAGTARRLRASVLREELRGGGGDETMRLLMRYTLMLLAMTGFTSACHKLHPLAGQLARWLLTMQDYAQGDDLRLTHELIANTLGVRRAGVTEASCELRDAGLIDYQRGEIHILDRDGLKARTCECYALIKAEYDGLYADLSARPD